MATFKLDSRLQQDCFLIGDFFLSQVLLMNDRNFPWLILVPRVAGISEIVQLSMGNQQQLLSESGIISNLLLELFPTDKLNVAALGNIVSQLHVHHIARRKDDQCWPSPVWGYGGGIAYRDQEKVELINKIQQELATSEAFVPFSE